MANRPGEEVTGAELVQGIKRAVDRLEAEGIDAAVLEETANVKFLSEVDDGLHSLADEAEGDEDADPDADDDTNED